MYAPDNPGRIIAEIPKKPAKNIYHSDSTSMGFGLIFDIWYEIRIPIKSEINENVFFWISILSRNIKLANKIPKKNDQRAIVSFFRSHSNIHENKIILVKIPDKTDVKKTDQTKKLEKYLEGKKTIKQSEFIKKLTELGYKNPKATVNNLAFTKKLNINDLHDSSLVMLIPLILLSIGAIFSGYLFKSTFIVHQSTTFCQD